MFGYGWAEIRPPPVVTDFRNLDAFEGTDGLVTLWKCDLTLLNIDAVVNSVNTHVAPRGGLCGLICAAAGPEIVGEMQKYNPSPSGTAVITPGFKLPAKFCIHAIGPVGRKPEVLEAAYKSILGCIDGEQIRSVGLCCLSVRSGYYPLEEATEIAVAAVHQFLNDEENRAKVDRIVFVTPNDETTALYEKTMAQHFQREGKKQSGDV